MTKYTKSQIKDSVKRVNEWITKNNKVPNTVRVNKDTLKWADWLKLAEIKDGKTRIDNWIKKNNQYPNYVTILDIQINMKEYRIMYNMPVVTNKTTPNKVADHFFKVFGKCNTLNECLKKIENHGYSYYYNDVYTNKATIDRIKAKKGVNCTDSCHLVYWLCKYFNLEVRCLHVQCKTGGHVRLQYKKNNKWVNIDPASILSTGNNNGITGIWCPNAPLIAVNPAWWKNDLNR